MRKSCSIEKHHVIVSSHVKNIFLLVFKFSVEIAIGLTLQTYGCCQNNYVVLNGRENYIEL